LLPSQFDKYEKLHVTESLTDPVTHVTVTSINMPVGTKSSSFMAKATAACHAREQSTAKELHAELITYLNEALHLIDESLSPELQAWAIFQYWKVWVICHDFCENFDNSILTDKCLPISDC